MTAPLIVGAGPAGIRAAQTLVAAGLRPQVVDEAPASGGQIYRQPLQPDGRSAQALYGSEAGKAVDLHRTFDGLLGKIDYYPNALLWNLRDGQADLAIAGRAKRIAYDGLILATGATDRILPVPGWTLPGVYTLGGSQVALKAQGCAIGRKVVFCGTGPLLYLVAWQYWKAGVTVAAVLDTAPASAKLALVRGLALAPAIVLRGLKFGFDLKRAGVPIHSGVEALRFGGTARVEGISWRAGGREHHLLCDGIGYGLSLRPETQVADLAGCAFRFSARDRAFVPQKDAAGRSSVAGVYLAGDGAGIAGADAAERAGERAALALLQDRAFPVDTARCAALESDLAKIEKIRDMLEAAFPFPAHWAATLPDDLTLCRCEDVSVGSVRQAVQAFGLTEMNRLKAVTRTGMGRCQGRMCGAAVAEVLAGACGREVAAVGRLRGQAPVKPVPLTLEAAE